MKKKNFNFRNQWTFTNHLQLWQTMGRWDFQSLLSYFTSFTHGKYNNQMVSLIYLIGIISNDRVTSTDRFQETHFIRFKCNQRSKWSCRILSIGLDSSTEFTVSRKEFDATSYSHRQLSSRGKSSIDQIVSNLLELHAVPKRTFLELFWKFSPKETEEGKLGEFASSHTHNKWSFWLY